MVAAAEVAAAAVAAAVPGRRATLAVPADKGGARRPGSRPYEVEPPAARRWRDALCMSAVMWHVASAAQYPPTTTAVAFPPLPAPGFHGGARVAAAGSGAAGVVP